MSWIVVILIIVGIIWFVKRRKNSAGNMPQIPQNQPQNHPQNGSHNRPKILNRPQQNQTNSSNQQQPVSETGNKQCPYCAETIKAQAIVCRFCGRDLTGMNTQMGNTNYSGGYYEGNRGSLARDAMMMGGTAIATHAILNGMTDQDDPNAVSRDAYSETGFVNDTDNGFYESDNDNGSFTGGNGLSALSSLDSSNDDNNSAAWVTDESDSSDSSGWMTSGDDDNSSWSSSNDDDSDSGWSFGSDDNDSDSSWSFGSDDNDSDSSWSFGSDDNDSDSGWSFGSDDSDSGSSWSFGDDD